jgi:hypothetical protein
MTHSSSEPWFVRSLASLSQSVNCWSMMLPVAILLCRSRGCGGNLRCEEEMEWQLGVGGLAAAIGVKQSKGDESMNCRVSLDPW